VVVGDEADGADLGLRAELEARGVGYVLAVACDHCVVADGATDRADALLRRVPARAWQCVSAGRAQEATAPATGRLSASTTAAPILVARQGSAGCCSAATA